MNKHKTPLYYGPSEWVTAHISYSVLRREMTCCSIAISFSFTQSARLIQSQTHTHTCCVHTTHNYVPFSFHSAWISRWTVDGCTYCAMRTESMCIWISFIEWWCNCIIFHWAFASHIAPNYIRFVRSREKFHPVFSKSIQWMVNAVHRNVYIASARSIRRLLSMWMCQRVWERTQFTCNNDECNANDIPNIFFAFFFELFHFDFAILFSHITLYVSISSISHFQLLFYSCHGKYHDIWCNLWSRRIDAGLFSVHQSQIVFQFVNWFPVLRWNIQIRTQNG